MCLMCKHYDAKYKWCAAFPGGIPKEILYGEPPWHIPDEHLEPINGQTGDTTFEPAEGVTEDMIGQWGIAKSELMIFRIESEFFTDDERRMMEDEEAADRRLDEAN